MDFWLLLAFAVLMLLASAALMVSHARTWRRVRDRPAPQDAKETQYRWRQFRRRMQTTAMLAIAAVALLVGHWIDPERVSPLVFLLYWAGVILLVLWVALLAVADMISTKSYFGRVQQSQLVEKAKLQAELRKIQSSRGNGRPGNGSNGGEPDGRDDA